MEDLLGQVINLMGSNQQLSSKMSHDKNMKTMDAVLQGQNQQYQNDMKVALEQETTQRMKDQMEHEENIRKLTQDFSTKQDSINKEWQLKFEEMKQNIKSDYDNQQLITQALLPVQMQQIMAKQPDPTFSYDDLSVQISAGERETKGLFNPLMDSDMTQYLKGGVQGIMPQMAQLRKLDDNSVDKQSAITRLVDMYNTANVDAYANDDIFSNDEEERDMIKMISQLLKQLNYDTNQLEKPVFSK